MPQRSFVEYDRNATAANTLSIRHLADIINRTNSERENQHLPQI